MRRRRKFRSSGFPESTLELIQRNLVGRQFTLKNLQRIAVAGIIVSRRVSGGLVLHGAVTRGQRIQLLNQVVVEPFGFKLHFFELGEDLLNPIQQFQDERHGVRGDRDAVAELAHQRFRRVRQYFQARQAEETTGALDRVNQAENIVENLCVVRLLLELYELNIDNIETFFGFGQKFCEQIIHDAKTQTRPQREFKKRACRRAVSRDDLNLGRKG